MWLKDICVVRHNVQQKLREMDPEGCKRRQADILVFRKVRAFLFCNCFFQHRRTCAVPRKLSQFESFSTQAANSFDLHDISACRN